MPVSCQTVALAHQNYQQRRVDRDGGFRRDRVFYLASQHQLETDRELPVMRFGYFDDARREYVITTPRTPYPWINYLGSENFFSLISHQAGGYCFYKDARLRRLLRYRYNNAPTDVGGRYFFIHENGDTWTPMYMPVKRELENYECRHG